MICDGRFYSYWATGFIDLIFQIGEKYLRHSGELT